MAAMDDPIPKFSFCGRKLYYDNDQIQELTAMACRGMPSDHVLVRAMRRGIGVHHGGLPTRYRQNVEILFRCRHLQCIIARTARTHADRFLPSCRICMLIGQRVSFCFLCMSPANCSPEH